MRTAGYALLGFLGGTAAGLVLAVLLAFLLYDVLGAGSGQGGDHMSGMAALLLLLPVMGLIGGIGGAAWLGRKARSGAAVPAYGVAAVVIALVLGLLFFGGGGIFF